MGPKKAMKAMKKNQGLGKPKGVLKKPKAKAKAKASSSKNAALGKAAKAKNDLNKTNLEKLGKMSLDEKVQAAANQGGTSEDQAQFLKEHLTKEEHAKVWSRHQTHLKNNPLEKGELAGLTKKEKGIKAAQWFMETSGKKYLHVSKEVRALYLVGNVMLKISLLVPLEKGTKRSVWKSRDLSTTHMKSV